MLFDTQQELERKAKERENKNNMPKELYVKMGKTLKDSRINHTPSLTQKDLANKLGVSESTIGAIEQGRRHITADLRAKISAIFKKDIFEDNILEILEESIDTLIKTENEYNFIMYYIYIKFFKNKFSPIELETFKKKYISLKEKLKVNKNASKRINRLIEQIKNIFVVYTDYEKLYNMLQNLDKTTIVTNYKIPLFDSTYINREDIYYSELCGSHTINRNLYNDQNEYVAILLNNMSNWLNYKTPKYKSLNIITVRLCDYCYDYEDIIISINGKWYIKNIHKENNLIILTNPCNEKNEKLEYTNADIQKLNIKIIGTIVDIYFNHTFIEEKDKYITPIKL